ncbi:MAG TPA: MinD/ParA family protein, partial [Rhodoglobus sp.]|nr:MinD/ParA family protein [Rhodoglobus sp.]
LVKNAVVALNTSTQGTNLVKLEEIEAHFRSRVREIVRVPYDPALATGSTIHFDELRPLTREAARELAALVVDGLPEHRDA